MSRVSLLLFSLLLCLPASLHAKTKIALIAGRDSHGAKAHNWGQGVDLLAHALNQESGLPVDVITAKTWPTDPNFFKDVKSIVILSDGGGRHPTIPHFKQLAPLMESGVGFVCVHYAVEVPKGDPGDNFLNWLGGYFETNWSVNPHWTADFELIPGHPTTNGVKPFSLNDEWYYHMRFQPEGVTPILSALPPAETLKRKDGRHSNNPHVRAAVLERKEKQHVAWAYQRPNNKGRAFGITGAHYHSAWDNDSFRTLVLNAIVWTAGIEVPKKGVTSKPNPTSRFGAAQAKPVAQPAKGIAAEKDALAASKTVTIKTPGNAVAITAKLKKGQRDLYLLIDEATNDNNTDWANWVEPSLIDANGNKTKLTDLNWKSATSGWAGVRKNANCQDKPMKVAGKPIAFGIGAHAPSLIHYQLPKNHNFVTFTAIGALDDGGATQDSGKNASVRFLVFDKTPKAIAKTSGGNKDESDHPSFLPPEDLVVPEGYEVAVWAKSPLFYNPTNMDIDHLGRIWVAEGRNYRRRKGAPEGDRIVVVKDTDGDGIADASHVFVQEKGFLSPLGVAVIDNKIIVSQPPDLIVYTDVNRNAVYDEATDKREVLLTGFDGKNHDHSLHAVTAGPNGQWYFNHGNKGSQVTDKDGWQLNAGSFYSMKQISGKPSSDGQIYLGGVALRVNPDGTGLRPIGHNFRNSYEQTVSSYGDVFQNDNDDPPASRTAWLMEYGNMGYTSRDGTRKWGLDKMSGQDTPTAEWRQEDPGVVPAGDVYGGGSPTGITIYENGPMADKLKGYVISCEPARNHVFGYHPTPAGAGIALPKRDIFLTSNPEEKFAGADFARAGGNVGNISLFRPSDVAIGPDGAIYVADWFDFRVGGHGTRDKGQTGTIYRITPKGKTLTTPTYDPTTIAGQIELLKSPAVNVREIGRSRLEAAGTKAIPAVQKLLTDPNPFIQARAVWLLAKLGPEGLALVEKRLSHSDSQARVNAFRALRHENHKVLEHAAKLAKDPAPAVRREVAIALRYVPFEQAEQLLLALAQQYDGKDRYYVEAFGIAATDKEEKTYAALKAKRNGKTGYDPVYAGLVWRLHPVSALPELEAWALDDKLDDATRRSMLFAISLIEAPQAAESMVKIANSATGATASLAREFIAKRDTGIWRAYQPANLLAGKAAAEVVYADMLAPTKIADEVKLPPAADILALAPNLDNGKTAIARCYMCHKVGSAGIEFGPALTGWGRGQSRDVILTALLDPSADLAHGYEGTELTVKGNKRIQGFIQAEGDPIVIRTFGGQDVVIDAAHVLSRKKLKTSLMVPANKLGMSPQDLRDVVEYLKHN